MKIRTTLPILLVTTLTAWSLLACGAPAAEQAAMADKPTAEAAMSDTKAMTETTAMADTKAMTESAAMSDTKAMTETEVMSDTKAMTESAAMSDAKAMTDTGAMTETTAMVDTKAMTDTALAEEAMMSLQGSLVGLGDGQHEGSGNVEISGKPGAYTLKLTNFTSSEGPDLRVVLSKNADPINEKVGTDWLDLGKLQSLSGDQAYALPADADLSAYKSVVVYCVSFDFVFSAATLQ